MNNSIKVQSLSVSDKDVYIVEEHHHILLPWAEFRRKSGLHFTSLTLDHHTDVLAAGKGSKAELNFDFTDEKSLLKDLSKLRHDEHLDWAVKSGVIERAVIIAHENFTVPASPELQVVCDPEWPPSQEILDSSAKAKEMADNVLDSAFLDKQLKQAGITSGTNLLLDIDLDYFLTEASLHPKNPESFFEIVRRSPIITVSLERDWVKILRLKNENISAESILPELIKLIRRAYPLTKL